MGERGEVRKAEVEVRRGDEGGRGERRKMKGDVREGGRGESSVR